MDAYGLYKSVFFDYIGPYGGLVGVNMVVGNYKPSAPTYYFLTLNAAFMFSCLYTMFTYDVVTMQKASVFFGLGVQGLTKYAVLLVHCEDIRGKVKMLERVYTANRNTDSPNHIILHKWAKLCHMFVKYGSVPCAAAVLTLCMWPIVNYFWNGSVDFVMPSFYPLVDETTYVGYAILAGDHLSLMFLAFCGTCGADFMLVVLVIHMWPMCLIFARMFDELNAALESNRLRDSAAVHRHFLNLLDVHKDMCIYLEGISNIYFYMLLSELMSCGQCLCAVLFCLSNFNWVPLYFFWILMFTKLLAYCSLGTIAELATDHIYSSIVQIKWYLMTEEQKHYFRFMVQKAQSPTILMAGTVPLNLNTFIQVMKTVYSVGMLLAKSV